MDKIFKNMELLNLTDRQLLEKIYLLLLQLSQRLDSPEANMNDFTMNIAANLISNRLYENRGF